MHWRIFIPLFFAFTRLWGQSGCELDTVPPDLNLYMGIATVLLDAEPFVILHAIDLDAGTTDNCTAGTNLVFSFSEDPEDQQKTVTCLNAGIQTLTLFAHDESGNYSSGSVTIRIGGLQCRLANAQYELAINFHCSKAIPGESIGIPKLAFTVGSGPSATLIPKSYYSTELLGYSLYIDFIPDFFDQYSGQSIQLLLIDGDPDFTTGISTLDLLALSKHILGIETFSDNYYRIAADVTGDGKITARDIIQLRRLVLGIDEVCPDVPNWRYFFQSETQFQVDDLKNNRIIDCIAVKMGDVNRPY